MAQPGDGRDDGEAELTEFSGWWHMDERGKKGDGVTLVSGWTSWVGGEEAGVERGSTQFGRAEEETPVIQDAL